MRDTVRHDHRHAWNSWAPLAYRAAVLSWAFGGAMALLACVGCDREDLTSGRKPSVEPLPPPPVKPPVELVKINEFMPENVDVLEDDRGEFPPWIELFNPSDEPIDLANVAMGVSFFDPTSWRIPDIPEAVVPAKGFLIIYADGDTQNPDDLHASFVLQPGSISIFYNAGTDSVLFNATELPPNASAGRSPDGQGDTGFLETPTPGAPNSEKGNPPEPPEPVEGEFVRGDVNEDGRLNVADMNHLLGMLFRGERFPECRDRADVNDDGKIEVADPLTIGNFIFRRGARPPAPYPDEGRDPTSDTLPCPPER